MNGQAAYELWAEVISTNGGHPVPFGKLGNVEQMAWREVAARQPQPAPLPHGIALAALERIRQEYEPGTMAHDTALRALDDTEAARAGQQPAPERPSADRIVRDILESLCRRDGLSLESTVVPGEPARNYALAERLGIGHVFGLPDVPQAAPGMVPLDPAVLHQEVHRLSRQAEAVKALARQHALGDTPRADLARAVLEQLGES